MTVAMVYGGYGFGGSWILIVFVGIVLIRVLASRRNGSRSRPPVQGPNYWGSPRPVPPDQATPADETAVLEQPAPAGGYKIPPGWFPDPTGKFDQRYWSGTAWTEHVTKDGVPGTDAPPASLSGTG